MGLKSLKWDRNKMKQNNKQKILRIFYENSEKTFTFRELSKLTKIPRSTTHRIVSGLKKEKLVDKENKALNNSFFKIKKSNYFIEELFLSGLVDFLIKELNPSCIIIFGSIAKGDSIKESDVDIFVETPISKTLDLSLFEKRIGHKIDLFVESNINNLQKNLFNNVINGIKIFGNIKIK